MIFVKFITQTNHWSLLSILKIDYSLDLYRNAMFWIFNKLYFLRIFKKYSIKIFFWWIQARFLKYLRCSLFVNLYFNLNLLLILLISKLQLINLYFTNWIIKFFLLSFQTKEYLILKNYNFYFQNLSNAKNIRIYCL